MPRGAHDSLAHPVLGIILYSLACDRIIRRTRTSNYVDALLPERCATYLSWLYTYVN